MREEGEAVLDDGGREGDGRRREMKREGRRARWQWREGKKREIEMEKKGK